MRGGGKEIHGEYTWTLVARDGFLFSRLASAEGGCPDECNGDQVSESLDLSLQNTPPLFLLLCLKTLPEIGTGFEADFFKRRF